MENPILENVKNLYVYILFWIFITLIYIVLLHWGSQVALGIVILDGVVSFSLLGGLGLSAWYSVKYLQLDNSRSSKLIFSHVLSGLMAAAVWLLLSYSVLIFVLNGEATFESFFFNTLPWRFLIGLLFYFMITLFYYIFIISKNLQEKNLKEKELKNLITEAELRSLKFQINPHFIFNSLNSISALTDIDKERSKTMVQRLADFLRYSLQNSNRDKNSLDEEIKTVELYLSIEKTRFGDKFEFAKNVDETTLEMMIPTMILQPLFENAIKHAVYEAINKIFIKLECKKDNEMLKITVENNFDSESVSSKGTGLGLKIIKSRLELFYNRNDLFKFEKNNELFRVTMWIPLS